MTVGFGSDTAFPCIIEHVGKARAVYGHNQTVAATLMLPNRGRPRLAFVGSGVSAAG